MSKEQGLIQSDPATSPHHQIGKYISKHRTLFIRYNGRIAVGNLSVVQLIDCTVCRSVDDITTFDSRQCLKFRWFSL